MLRKCLTQIWKNKNLNLTHNLGKFWEKKRKVILPHQLTIFTFHFFQVCLSAKMQNETDLIFSPIYLKVMWFYAINPIPVAHFMAKTCNNTQWSRINSEKVFLFLCICLFTRYFYIYSHGLNLTCITCESIEIKC